MEQVNIDLDDLTIGEMLELEEVTGRPFAEMLSKTDAKVMLGLVYVMKKREQPDFTLDDAKQLRIADIQIINTMDPTGGGGSKSSPSSARSTGSRSPKRKK